MSRSLQLVVSFALLCFVSAFSVAQTPDDSSAVVEVYLDSVRTIVVTGATDAAILDPEIARVECTGDDVRFTAIQRGETLAVVHANGRALSLIVRVVLRPAFLPPQSLRGPQIERGVGAFASDVQIDRAGAETNVLIHDSLFWRQQIGDRQVGLSLSSEHSAAPGQYPFNLRSGNFNFRTPHLEVNLLDQNVNLSGADLSDRIPAFSLVDTLQIRGAGLSMIRGKNKLSFFAGATIPYYFLSLASTRDVAGASFRRHVTDKLSFFGAGTFLRLPAPSGGPRRLDFMQEGGLRYAPSRRLEMDGIAGVGTSGGLLRGDVNYSGTRFIAFVSALRTSPEYPLNQVQSLFSGRSSVRTGVTAQLNRRVGGSFYFEHTSSESVLLHLPPAHSNYFSPSVSVNLSRKHSATLTYTRSFSDGGFQSVGQTGSRFDVSLHSTIRPRITNSVQLLLGSVQDPLQTNSESQFSFNDTLLFSVRAASLQLSVSNNRTNPSLMQKLNQEISLLSPQLQQQFLQNPLAFSESDLPPDLRALLDSQRPISTAVALTAELPLTSKLSFSPNFSLDHDTVGARQRSWASFFGYNLSYAFSRSLQFRSSLNSVWMVDNTQAPFRRTTVVSAGIVKTFGGSPLHLLARRSHRIIQGRVYRDDNINGVFNRGEQGIAGVEVQLDSSETVVTDRQGIYRFSGAGGGVHRVSINLAQFSDPVRMTTSGEVAIYADAPGIHTADFGIVNFARLMGTLFNDLRFDGKIQPDSIGVGNVRMFLRKGDKVAAILDVPPNGHFEEDDIAPGDYTLTIDPNTIPANYSTEIRPIPIHISPVSTVVTNIPLHAMRSISGHVFLKVKVDGTSKEKLVPLAGVKLSAGVSVSTTGDDGAFVLRNLPAGDLTVTLVPLKQVPKEVNLPSGRVRIPAEPVQIQAATIVLGNREVLQYLVPNADLH